MATKDISDLLVCKAYRKGEGLSNGYVDEILMAETGEVQKVCLSAMSRACGRGLVDYGISLRSGFLTKEGRELLEAGE